MTEHTVEIRKDTGVIQSKKELKEYIEMDNSWFQADRVKEKILERYAAYPSYALKKYLYYLRKQEYYINTACGSKRKGLMGLYYERKKNRCGMRLGIEIGPNSFGKGLQIYHAGNIVVNPAVRAGEHCRLHGGNCIGNNGKTDGVPQIGSHVDIGYGAVLMGDIVIADHVTIGANAVVNRSVLESGSTVAGVPARKIQKKERQ